VNSSALAEWSLFGFGVVATIVGYFVARHAPKLFQGKSNQNVVDTANAIIEMYEKHVGILQIEVTSLKDKVASLSAKLDDTLKKNEALQNLLLASPAMKLPEAP
jgi:peptidoglycan hydrolase CwlO-like protein